MKSKNHKSKRWVQKGCQCLCVSQRQRECEGVKNAALSQNPQPTLTPCLGLQKQDRLAQCDPATQPPPPQGSSRQLRNVRIGIQQGLQLGREFLSSSVWPSHCLALASQCSLSYLCCHPSSLFSYCSCSRARVSRKLRHLILMVVKVKI